MSDFVEVKSNLRKVTRALAQSDKAIKKAVVSSINRAVQRSKTETGRKVRERYVIKQKEVVQTLKVTKAKSDKQGATLISRGSPLPLINFNVSPKKRLKKQPKVLKAAVLRGGARKSIPRAFVASGGSHHGVFERVGKQRMPLSELKGPAVPSMVGSDEVREHVQKTYADEMHKRLPHELDRTLGGLKT